MSNIGAAVTKDANLVTVTKDANLVTVTKDANLVTVTKDERKGSRHGPRFSVTVTVTTEAKLLELAEAHGYTVTALIRYCIDCQLPELEVKLKSK